MQLTLESFEAQLTKKKLALGYLLVSTNAFLLQTSRDAIWQVAASQGFSERHIREVKNAHHCDELNEQNSTTNLFHRPCVDVRLPGPPDALTGKKLSQWVHAIHRRATLAPLAIVSIESSLSKLERADWFKKLASEIAFVVITPPTLQQLPYWLRRELQRAQLTMTDEAMAFFVRCTEGNLPAAKQTIQKLSLAYADDQPSIDIQQLRSILVDDVAFEVFHLTDAILQANVRRCRRILDNLASKHTPPALVLGYLMRLLRIVAAIQEGLSQGSNLTQLFDKNGVWQKQRAPFQKIAHSLSQEDIKQLFYLAHHIDRCIKGIVPASSWRYLQQFSLSLAGFHSPCIKLSLQY